MSFITVTGVLTNPSGAVLPNYNILFEAIRTSDTVINNTDVLIVTNSSGGYSFELGYGTYTLKIKSGREARYSTVASNILIYSPGLNNNSIQQIILAQDGLEDINIKLIDQFLQIRADVLLNAQNASTSETNAAASAASALTSKNAAEASATSASSSATTATTKASEAAASATSASSSAATATTKASEAASSATSASSSATSATASATSASSSATTATTKATEAATSATTATTKATEAAASAASALASKNAAATSETNAAASAAAALASEQQAARYTASLTGGIVENGGVNLSSGVAPTPLPDGLGGYTSTLWKVTVGGTVNAVNYAVGDSIVYSKTLGSYYKIDSTDQVSSVNGMSGAVNITSITGNAGSATILQTARVISISGDGTGSANFDGSKAVSIALVLANTGVTAGTYKSVTVDAKGRVTAGTNPTTLAGYGITDAQPLDAELTAISGLTTNGIVVKTAAGTATTRSVAVTGTGLSITNADGVAGNPTITSNATNLNTVSTIVARDASGNFSAGIITAALSGNASTATKLATARTINGVAFDGTANITIADNTKLPLAGGTLTGDLTLSGAIELKSPNGAETLRIEHSTDISKTVNAYRLIQKGDYGIGDGAFGIINNNFNDSSTECSFIKNNNDVAALNYPTFPGAISTTPFVGVNINHSGNWGLQILGNVNSTTEPRLAFRSKANAVFSSWYELYTQRSILGAVSQSSGIPTGGVIERGSNANGDYVKFADGTLICRSPGVTKIIQANNNMDYAGTWPAVFIDVPAVSANAQEVVYGAARWLLTVKQVWADSTQYQTTINSAHGADLSVYSRIVGIGRWF